MSPASMVSTLSRNRASRNPGSRASRSSTIDLKLRVTAEPGSPADAPAVFLPTVAGGAQPFGRAIVVPAQIADVGPRAAKRFANFFGSIANDNTRAATSRIG